jgi:DNA repair protein RecO (recombination protein O)
MITTTQSLVLRSIKYGETSLVSTQFTRIYGVQTYLVQGVRVTSAKGRSSRAGLLQPGMLLDITAYHKPQGNLQRLKEFTPSVIYRSIHEEVIKNSIALFSAELLLRLLPEAAPMPELFDFAMEYFRQLDLRPPAEVSNFPVFFALQCSRALGYELAGHWSEATPYLNLIEGGFTADPPFGGTAVTTEDAATLAKLQQVRQFDELAAIDMNGAIRQRLLEWYLQFLHRHTEHMRPVRSLQVLQAVLHGI